jgi:hypothetical protein
MKTSNMQTLSAQLPAEPPEEKPIRQTLSDQFTIRLTLPENANIYASQYQLYLPSKEELKRKLIEWSGSVPDTQTCR